MQIHLQLVKNLAFQPTSCLLSTHAAMAIPLYPKYDLVYEEVQQLITFAIIGDGRCFFRSIIQWQEDPHRAAAYYNTGEHADPELAAAETKKADKLREDVVAFAVRHDLNEHAEPTAEGWKDEMSRRTAWADEVAIASCSAMLQQPILILSWNAERGHLYCNFYLEEFQRRGKKCIPLYFNGRDHYELIDEVWLQDCFLEPNSM